MRVKRIAAVLVICLTALLFGSVGPVYSKAKTTDGYTLAAQNERLELWMDGECLKILIRDKQTGMEWKSSVSDENFDIESVSKKFRSRVGSPFEISYTDLKKGYGAVITNSLAGLEFTAKKETIPNGVKVYYDMAHPQVRLSVEYLLSEDSFTMRLPAEDFSEYGAYSVTSVRVLPFFGSAMDSTNGYFLYPDGCGAVMEFRDISHVGESELIMNVYNNPVEHEDFMGKMDQEPSVVMLPVYGVGIEKNGFLAVITEGSEASQIKLQPTNQVIPVNSINCEFTYRRSYNDLRVKDQSVKIFDQKVINTDRGVTYYFLERGKNTYSDMAGRYREFLMEEKGMARQSGGYALSLDLFMGIKERGMIFDVFKAVTTFGEAQTILTELKDSGIGQIDVSLDGWMKNGYGTEPVLFPAASKLGGTKGLKALAKYAADNGIRLSLKADLVSAIQGNKGFSARNDVIYLGNHAILTDYSESMFLLSPNVTLTKYKNFEKEAKDYGFGGVELASLGRYLLYNYNENDYTTTTEAMDRYAQILAGAKSAFGSVSVQSGNAWILPYVNKVTDIPDTDTGLQLTTKAVPFFQIAVHGLVEYTGTAGNLSSDPEKEKLKWVEFGYLPYYELTFKGSEELMYTDYNSLFTSTYTDWLEHITDVYLDMEQNLTGIAHETIDKHERLSSDLVKVTYSNGTCVYVNYGGTDVSADGIVVPARDYAVKEGK